MIVRMSKLEIAGPKELLLDVLAVIRELGTFQPEPETSGFVVPERRGYLHPLVLDERTESERLFLGNLQRLVSGVMGYLPVLETRESSLDPAPVLDTIAAAAEKHLAVCRELAERRVAFQREREELERCAILLTTIGGLIMSDDVRSGLEFIGITLRDPGFVEPLREMLARLCDGECTLFTTMAADGTLVGLIATAPSRSTAIKKALNDQQLPELPFPSSLRDLPLPERIRRVQERIAETEAGIAETGAGLEQFARRWLAIYRRIDQWLTERLALLSAASVVQETGMCFVILGWVRSDSRDVLGERLAERFGGRVALEELKILEQDLQRVPVALRNPAYFRPFELFTRLLPLPLYSSWDPTPFIGIFFPLFFGMMLGDAGHGLVVAFASLLTICRRPPGMVADAARILLVSALYAIIFGALFGEFFGEAGGRLLHLTPVLPGRSHAVMPMLVFSLALGMSHVVLGLAIGLVTALQRHAGREAAGRIASIGLIACLAALVVSLFKPSLLLPGKPLLAAVGVLIPLLLLSGGLLAPLEVVKQVGNIISYARIMAIGLSSALLANAANQLAGLSGDLVLGVLAAIMLHAVAIILGVFAPSIHALRLHFVEFFSKFVEHGGRRFEPLHRKT